MRIAVIFGGACALPPEAIGAIEILWTDIGRILAQRGHKVVLIGKGSSSVARTDPNVTYKLIKGFSPTSSRVLNLWMAFRACWQMLRMLDETDILVPNNVFGVWLARIFFRKKYKVLVSNVERMPKGLFRLRNAGADVYACPTSVVADRAKAQLSKRDRSRVMVVPNPIDSGHFNTAVSGGSKKPMEIVYHGRVNREKGVHLLAMAVNELSENYPEIRLKLIGAYDVEHGGSGDDYKRELDELSGHRIQWIGAIADRSKLALSIAESSIYCYPSIAEKGETFGVAPLEAMGLGLPVVVSSLECFRDFVEDGVTGLVFDHRAESPERLLSKKIQLLMDDVDLRERIAVAGAKKAEEFSNERVAELYERLFAEVCG